MKYVVALTGQPVSHFLTAHAHSVRVAGNIAKLLMTE